MGGIGILGHGAPLKEQVSAIVLYYPAITFVSSQLKQFASAMQRWKSIVHITPTRTTSFWGNVLIPVSNDGLILVGNPEIRCCIAASICLAGAPTCSGQSLPPSCPPSLGASDSQ